MEIVKIVDHAPSNFLIFELLDGWVALRCSGTEPKIKYYSEMTCRKKEEVHQCYERLHQKAHRLCEELLKPVENGLLRQGS